MAKIPKINLSSTINTFRIRFNRLVDSVGDLALLNTDSTATIVGSINSLDSNVGTRASLTTNNTTDIVSAVNEHDAELGTITSVAMGTTASTVSTAIAELDSRLDSINDTQLNTAKLNVSGNLDVQGITTLDSATVDGSLSVTGNLDVTGAMTSSEKAFTLTTTKNPSGTDVNLGDTFSVDIIDSDLIQSMIDSTLADSAGISLVANRSITNNKLTNNTITVNGIEITLGGSGNIDIVDSGTSIGLIKSSLKALDPTGILYDSARGEFSLSAIPNASLANSSFSVNGVSGSIGTGITVDIVDSAEVIELARTNISVTDNGGDGSLSYSSATGVITYTGPSASEARAHVSVTDAGGDGSLGYNSGTGVFTYTGPSAAESRAHFSAGEGIDISSGTISGEDATTSNKGIASFNSASFSTSSGAVSIKSGGVSNTQLAGSIANTKLANSTFSVNGVSGSLGGNIEIPTIDSNGTINLIGGQFNALPATISRSGALTLDVSGDITLDADGGQIYLDDAGSRRGYLDIATASTIKLYTGASTLNSTWSGDDLQVEGDVTSVSDIRTKENIETIADGLQIVDSLRGVYYNKIGETVRKVGVIAQEVETILPEVVKTNEDGMKSVDYGKMVGVLIEAIKELKAEIRDMKAGY